MKFAAKTLSALAAAGLLMGTMAATPAFAEKTILDYIDQDLKALDKEIVKIFTPAK